MENERGMKLPRRSAFFFRRASSLGLFVAACCLSEQIAAAPAIRTDFPCKGCLVLPPPEGATNAPLLVVLHGDAPGGKTPLVKRDSEPFVKAAAERGVAVFAPMCPKEQGCLVGSFWQWTQGDPPAWIANQVEALRKEYALDANRTWIAGWSGGASFLGYRYDRLGERYAAVIFAGGGMPPASTTCAPCSPPAYFLVGNKNPLHHLAKDLKTNVLSCTNDLTWDLLPGNDHAGEWRTLGRVGKVGELFDWLAKHPRNCGSGSASPPPSAVAPATSASSIPVLPSSAPVSKPAPVPTKGGGCAVSDASSSAPESLALVLVFGLIRGARRRNSR